jgi:hypothetical protein
VFVVALLASGTAIWSATAERASAAPITKVLWIWEENSDPTSLIGTCVTCQQLPYLNGLASTYGYATNARAASIPSLPNYIAATSGDTWGIADDGGPGKHPLSVLNLFDQLPLGQAKVFAEGMTANCQLVNGPKTDVNGSGFYVVRHTAWPYYTNSRSACLANQVPLDENLQAAVDGGLPALSIVVPANCNNFHKGGSSPDACVLAPGQTYASRADAWLQSHIPAIMAGPDWQAGELAIFIVWDEGKGPAPTNGSDCTTSTLKACKIPLVVLSSGTTGVVDNTPYTTYSVLRTTEELLGLPLIGKAATATSMAAGFGLQAGGSPPPTTPNTTIATTTTSGGPDTAPPTGFVAAPANGATVSGVTTVSVSASDNVGVVQVNLLVDAVFVKAMKTTPYNFTLDTRTYSNGSHTLFAKIYDAAGNKTVTSSVAVTFQN